MSAPSQRLERGLGVAMTAGVRGSALCLILGLAMWLAAPDLAPAGWLLNAGILILMATPALRVLLSAAEAVRERDWQHVATIVAVAVLLALTLIYASRS
jgi:uncharacterized membrane protein